MPNISLVRLLLLFVLILPAACKTTRYDYTPPSSEQGRTCVAHCSSIRESCRGNEMQRAQMEKHSCERSSDSTYRACMSRAGNKDQEKDCERKRSSCWVSENTERCEGVYRECFSNCGGSIRTYTK